MANNFKIIGATPVSGKSLCLSCTHAVVIRGQNCEERIICQQSGDGGLWGSDAPVVRFRVAECSEYRAYNQLSIQAMQAMAWHVVARKRGAAGFSDGVRTNGDAVPEISVEILEPENQRRNGGR